MTADSSDLGQLLHIVVAVLVIVPVLTRDLMVPMMGLWGWGHMADGRL